MSFTGQTQRWLWDNNLENKILLLETQDGTHKNTLGPNFGVQKKALGMNSVLRLVSLDAEISFQHVLLDLLISSKWVELYTHFKEKLAMKSDISAPDILKTLKDIRGGKCFEQAWADLSQAQPWLELDKLL